MEKDIKDAIKHLAKKKLSKYRQNEKIAEKYREKYHKRTAMPPGLPQSFNIEYAHHHFDPIYCLRNKNFLAKTLWNKCQNGNYEPTPALVRYVPKPDGSLRPITEFSIPDAAVSRVIYKRISPRNAKKQSANSFAYRQDVNIFDAILKLKSSIDKPKVFISQYDFKQYFDSIPHDHLLSMISNREYFIATQVERGVIRSFMRHRFADADQYQYENYTRRDCGTPQGSSVSLLLANLANAPLDKELERLNGQFVRYADDIVNVSYNYEDALRTESAFYQHCKVSGIPLNRKKSKGVFILSDATQEVRSRASFTFLGYKISKESLSVSDKSLAKLKLKLSRLINLYLHRHPRVGYFNINRTGRGYDYDLIACISEIRNVLYGGVSEQQIDDFLRNGSKLPRMRGYMAFYCLMDTVEDLKSIDGWLVSNLYQALRKRKVYLNALGHLYTAPTVEQLITGSWFTNPHGGDYDARLPSVIRGWRAARKYYYTYGLQDVRPPEYLGYY